MSTPSTTVTSRDDVLLFGESTGPLGSIGTPAVIAAMLDAGSGISDLIFSPGRPPQVELHGELVAVKIPNLPMLRAEDTAQIARDLIGGNETPCERSAIRAPAISPTPCPSARDSASTSSGSGAASPSSCA